MTPWFYGAVLPVCGVEVLLVLVRDHVVANRHQAELFVLAFYTRFQRAIVLVGQDQNGAPTYFGPRKLVHVVRELPFEIIPWRCIPYRTEPARSWKLPIPAEPERPAATPPPLDPRSNSQRFGTAAFDDEHPPITVNQRGLRGPS